VVIVLTVLGRVVGMVVDSVSDVTPQTAADELLVRLLALNLARAGAAEKRHLCRYSVDTADATSPVASWG